MPPGRPARLDESQPGRDQSHLARPPHPLIEPPRRSRLDQGWSEAGGQGIQKARASRARGAARRASAKSVHGDRHETRVEPGDADGSQAARAGCAPPMRPHELPWTPVVLGRRPCATMARAVVSGPAARTAARSASTSMSR